MPLDVAIGGGAQPPRRGVVGAIVSNFFPDTVPIPGGQKLDVLYQHAEVNAGGMFATGSYAPVARQPLVIIHGSDRLAADFRGGSASAEYRVAVTDMRAPLTVEWGEDGVPNPTNQPVTTISFTASGRVGTVLTREVRVRVTDVDGLTATASRTVEIHFVDQDAEDQSPLCRARPWLCEE